MRPGSAGDGVDGGHHSTEHLVGVSVAVDDAKQAALAVPLDQRCGLVLVQLEPASDRFLGVVGALDELGDVKMPVVVRLEGTNVEEGRRILEEADFDFIVADQMASAAEKAVAAAGGAGEGA